MKKFASVFALLAVLAMAGTTMAGVTVLVIPDPDNPTPAPGLTAWVVRGVCTEGWMINTVSQIHITDGVVHNVWQRPAATGDPLPTPREEEHEKGMWKAEWRKFDTFQIYLPTGADATTDIDPPVETNDGSDPAGLDLIYMAGFPDWDPVVGMGTFIQPYEGTIAFSPGYTELDILHVVLHNDFNPLVHLDIRLLGETSPDNAYSEQFRDIPVGIPEPSTLILLVLGGLCLVGYRLRK